jgi:exodeoxyribonuclease VII small subunit
MTNEFPNEPASLLKGFSMTEKQTPIEKLNYEQAFSELEQIVAALEIEERSLDEALTQFERGQSLARHCARLLDKADLKVQQIAGEDLIPFDAE